MKAVGAAALAFASLAAAGCTPGTDRSAYCGPPEYEALLDAGAFAGAHVGEASRTPDAVFAMQWILERPWAGEAVKELLERASIAGKLYALCGLYWTDRTAFSAGVERLAAETSQVQYFPEGCLSEAVAAGALVRGEISSGRWPRIFKEFEKKRPSAADLQAWTASLESRGPEAVAEAAARLSAFGPSTSRRRRDRLRAFWLDDRVLAWRRWLKLRGQGGKTMRRTACVFGILLGGAVQAPRLGGQDRVSFDLRLERQGFPDLDSKPVLVGDPGTDQLFTAGMVITSSSNDGVQGWSISLVHEGTDVVGLSVEGTASASKSEGGLFDNGFIKYEIADEARDQTRTGVIQAVVLGFLHEVTLPPRSSTLVGVNTYRGRIEAQPQQARIAYVNGLRGSGQPVQNTATISGSSVFPTLSERFLALDPISRLPELDCANGADDNGNGWADCEDPSCRLQPACGAEECSDGKDNDGDGLIDCEDFDCGRNASCRSAERCDDGADNDRDLLTDCADPECFEIGDCPGPEVCGDVIDNDLDGKLDCQDSDCFGVLPCIGREQCGDGMDNNGDGKADCQDPQCARSPSCITREDCADGIDNDADDYVDCADFDCFAVAPCPGFELCKDGLDNNGDGKVDCDDPQCRDAGVCRGAELCSDGIDNDRDGAVDCADTDCFEACRPRESCNDGADNDGDSLADCADPDCRRAPSCVQPEVCTDGLDNDGDSLADCADPDCLNNPVCPSPERCSDGVDNDRDLLTDCFDPDCRRSPACLTPEDCSDGKDNDDDLRVDCDDFDCRGKPACPGLEVCEDGKDNDGDSLADCADADCRDAPFCAQGGGGFDLVLVAERSRSSGERNVVLVDPETDPTVPVTVFAAPFPSPQPDGLQGWSLSIAHDGALIGFDPNGGAPTIDGTDAAGLFEGGFRKTEEVKGSGQGGGGAGDVGGFVSAVVLSFTTPSELDPTRAQSLARARYLMKEDFGAGGVESTSIEFKDGLRGSGQRVRNAFTVRGATLEPIHRVPLEIRRGVTSAPFVRGDANHDRKTDLADAIWCVNALVRNGPMSPCRLAADANADGFFDLADPVFLIVWQFLGGPAVSAPFPDCGRAVGSPQLDCPVGSVTYCD